MYLTVQNLLAITFGNINNDYGQPIILTNDHQFHT